MESSLVERALEGEDGASPPAQANQALLRYLLAHAPYDLAILKTKGQYVLYYREGPEVRTKPISTDAVRGAFVEEPVDSGWMAEGIKRWGSGPAGTFMVKFIPPGLETIYLSTLGSQDPTPCKLPLPALVFAGVNSAASTQGGSGTTYYVWALREEQFHASAKLWHAPFPNVYPDGHICFGDVRMPEISWKTVERAWQLFLESRFTTSLVEGKSGRYSQDVREMLLACRPLSRYPVEDLQPLRAHPGYGYTQSRPVVETVDDAVAAYLLRLKEWTR